MPPLSCLAYHGVLFCQTVSEILLDSVDRRRYHGEHQAQ